MEIQRGFDEAFKDFDDSDKTTLFTVRDVLNKYTDKTHYADVDKRLRKVLEYMRTYYVEQMGDDGGDYDICKDLIVKALNDVMPWLRNTDKLYIKGNEYHSSDEDSD